MRNKFSRKWVGSKQPRKQVKYRANAPLHLRHKMMAAHLSKELQEKHKKRSFPVRTGDKVRVLRGQFRGKIGEIEEVNLQKYKIYVKGIELKKKEGGRAVRYPINPSNTIILSFVEDKKRMEALKK